MAKFSTREFKKQMSQRVQDFRKSRISSIYYQDLSPEDKQDYYRLMESEVNGDPVNPADLRYIALKLGYSQPSDHSLARAHQRNNVLRVLDAEGLTAYYLYENGEITKKIVLNDSLSDFEFSPPPSPEILRDYGENYQGNRNPTPDYIDSEGGGWFTTRNQ